MKTGIRTGPGGLFPDRLILVRKCPGRGDHDRREVVAPHGSEVRAGPDGLAG